jgi:hypothetical protein
MLHPHKNGSDVLFSNVFPLILPKTDTNMKVKILSAFPFEKPKYKQVKAEQLLA